MAIKLGGGGGASFPTIFLHNSQTWVPPQDGNIMIHVIGAGGSGSGSHTTLTNIQSGAAGGYCRKNSLAVTTSGSFTVVVGAGGAARIGNHGAGTAGGTTTVAGTGLSATLTATGGAGGAFVNGFTVGGVGSNGNLNTTGGRGGIYIGGGAVGLTGTGKDGSNGGVYTDTRGGDCDILGDFYSSSLGQISGGSGGNMVSHNRYSTTGYVGLLALADPLAGGGSSYLANAVNFLRGSDAVIGGGGGWFYGNQANTSIWSGRGGEGCVVIQYIP